MSKKLNDKQLGETNGGGYVTEWAYSIEAYLNDPEKTEVFSPETGFKYKNQAQQALDIKRTSLKAIGYTIVRESVYEVSTW